MTDDGLGKEQHDPVTELAGLLTVMRRQTASADTALRRVESNRFNLLVVHAVAAMLIALLLMGSKPVLVGPAWEYLNRIPLFPYSFGAVMLVGGLVLLPGSIAKVRMMETVGLSLIYLWYLALSIGFAIPIFAWAIEATPPFVAGKPLPPDRPVFYTFVVYLHLAIIMRVHLWTLNQLRRQENKRREIEESGPS